MNQPKLLDLCGGVGGAARGYQLAGFHVTGVDIAPQPRYCGDEFHQGDALVFLLEHGHEFDAIHTSFPCQDSSALTKGNRGRAGWTDTHRDMNPVGRAVLDYVGKPIRDGERAGLRPAPRPHPVREMFELEVIRHRYFELGGWTMQAPAHRKHRGRVSGMRHGEWFTGPYFQVYGDGGGKGSVTDWQRAMGIDWTDVRAEIAQAIPPAYSEFIGRALLSHLVGELAA